MSNPKPFQMATAQTALRTLLHSKARRFLVADEVGLGKTVVAQEIIHQMMARKKGPLIVFYVCSNLSIANQNRMKLLEVLDIPEEQIIAQCSVDRLTLLPASTRPSHPKLHLYTLTPDTSLPMRAGKRRDGRMEERALIHNLVEQLYPAFFQDHPNIFFKRSAGRYWEWMVNNQRGKANDPELQKLFNLSVRKEFKVRPHQQVHTRLRKIKSDLEIIAHLRNALAAIAIEELKPDLVIFDEFQRFRDVITSKIEGDKIDSNDQELSVEYAANRVLKGLRGDGMKSPPALLLLSATPYRLYSSRWEDETTGQHHQEFFSLVEFLSGGGEIGQRKRTDCETAFQKLQQELRKGVLDSSAALQAKKQIESLLRPIVARTERGLFTRIANIEDTQKISARLKSEDLLIYKNLSESLTSVHKSSAVPFWTSIPMPMQFMGPDYTTWKHAHAAPSSGTPEISQKQRNQFESPETWPHPRFRGLLEEKNSPRLDLPWIAPSLPWWNLGNGWEEKSSKMILFSRFQAVPNTVAGLLSYDLECKLLKDQSLDYADITKRKLLQARVTQHNMLAIFTPWPWLIENTEPLEACGRGWSRTEKVVRQQICRALQLLGIKISNTIDSNRKLWELLIQIEIRSGHFPWVLQSWQLLHQSIQSHQKDTDNPDAGLGRLLLKWQKVSGDDLSLISEKELNDLVRLALQGVGNVVGRALSRHWSDAFKQAGYYYTIDVVWNGLRNYLDQRWFAQVLRAGMNYPRAILQAVKDGNLESVLDEHLWITRQLRGLSGKALAENLRDAIRLRSSNVTVHRLGLKEEDDFTLRCHMAIPYTRKQQNFRYSDSQEEKPLRADELRNAFNTPFWPNVLATTSIGQEGLDFHVWCDTLIHWDLCRNPVDLEQREGRIQRYGGLAIRRAIAEKHGKSALKTITPGESPWIRLALLAEQARPRDPSGLSPWWVFKDAQIHRYIFDLPLSDQEHHMIWLQQQRLLYRLVLGQPNQEDLVEFLLQKKDWPQEDIQSITLNLSPYFAKRRNTNPRT